MTVLKSIVVCFALANVGYFLWMQGIHKSHAVPMAQAPVGSLKLASEVNGALHAPAPAIAFVAKDDASGTDSSSAGSPDLLKRCMSVGPFKDVSEASHAAGTLRAQGYDPRQRVVDGEVWAGVWVYLPIPPNRAASDQVMTKLKGAGIDDALEMPGPGDGSVISLGLYSEQKRAQARVAQAQTLGLNPAVADRKRTGNVYWIDVDLKPNESTVSLSDLQGESGHISRLEAKACMSATAVPP